MTTKLLAAMLAAFTLTAVAVDDANARARHHRTHHPRFHHHQHRAPAIPSSWGVTRAPDVAGCVSDCWGRQAAAEPIQRTSGRLRAALGGPVASRRAPGRQVAQPQGVDPLDMAAAAPSFGSALVARMRAYIGTNPTGWDSLWCGRFMAMMAPQAASRVKNPNWALDWAALPRASYSCEVGAIAVLRRGRHSGHIGVVSGCDTAGNPTIISGNHGHRVGEGRYPSGLVVAYVQG